MQAYAETKAMGEMAMREACDGERLLTVAVAPHQVYGPRDMLFLHNMLKTRRLRIFASGARACPPGRAVPSPMWKLRIRRLGFGSRRPEMAPRDNA